ncbi:MAG: 16S rRNA (uracil(1498)-N(3))-methyltransferase [Oscillospiraceae bacterium]
MRRFFTEPENIDGENLYIIDDAVHITRVLRMNVGDEILAFDGSGYEYLASLIEINKTKCMARIKSKKLSENEPLMHVTIFQGIPKSGKMEQIVQKAVELGVYEIVPVAMDRCVAKIYDEKKGKEKIKRYQKVAVEAAKQCGRGILPKVLEPMTFDESLVAMGKLDLAIMPYEIMGHDGETNLKQTLKLHNDAKSVGVLIGPEGGFSDSEAERAKQNKLNLVGLGKRILRTETVGSTILSIIMYENNEI